MSCFQKSNADLAIARADIASCWSCLRRRVYPPGVICEFCYCCERQAPAASNVDAATTQGSTAASASAGSVYTSYPTASPSAPQGTLPNPAFMSEPQSPAASSVDAATIQGPTAASAFTGSVYASYPTASATEHTSPVAQVERDPGFVYTSIHTFSTPEHASPTASAPEHASPTASAPGHASPTASAPELVSRVAQVVRGPRSVYTHPAATGELHLCSRLMNDHMVLIAHIAWDKAVQTENHIAALERTCAAVSYITV
eukprot:gene23807-9370_t